jgi:acyl carrier protein
MKSVNAVVRSLLAQRLGRGAPTIRSAQDLAGDLDFAPLELVLIALDVEKITDVRIPVEGLASVRTVGELLSFFSRTVVRERSARSRRDRS